MSQIITGGAGAFNQPRTLNDTVENDFMLGGGGNDILLSRLGTDQLFGGTGDDRLADTNNATAVEFNLLSGGEGNDVLESSLASDTMDGGPGDDAMLAGQGNNIMIGGDGDDFLSIGFTGAAEFQNSYSGGAGNDAMFGAASRDTMDGGPGFDAMDAGDGNDTLRGGDDADLLIGGGGNDVLEGGGGIDTFEFSTTSGIDVITDFFMERIEIRGATSVEQAFVDDDGDGAEDDLRLTLPDTDPTAIITLFNQGQELIVGQELFFLV